MRVGVGLPNPVPGYPGSLLVPWAERVTGATAPYADAGVVLVPTVTSFDQVDRRADVVL